MLTFDLLVVDPGTLSKKSSGRYTATVEVLGRMSLGEVFMVATASRKRQMIKSTNMPDGVVSVRASLSTRSIGIGRSEIVSN